MAFKAAKWVLFLGLSVPGMIGAEVVRHPLNAGVALEYGQIYNSISLFSSPTDIKTFPIMKPIGWMVQSVTVNERTDVTVGVGAMFFYLYPEVGNQSSRIQLSGVSLAQASVTHTYGDDPTDYRISLGVLPYKYNPDSKNLGEYLFRSSLYPNTLTNGSWETINSAYAKINGAVLSKSFLDGKWKNDLLLVSSTDWPIYDLSLAYVTSYKPVEMLELGAGVNFFHLIPNQAGRTTPKKLETAYFTYQGEDYYAFSGYYDKIADFHAAKRDTYLANANAADSARAASEDAEADKYAAIADRVDSLNALPAGGGRPGYSYYTVQGTQLMGRFGLDFKPLLGGNVDLKIYGEATLLGVKNYPVFYENPMERMPIMLGVDLPTFGLLDKLSVEAEYFKNPYLANYANIVIGNYSVSGPIPDFRSPAEVFDRAPNQGYTADDWKWSVYAKKNFSNNISAFVQVARDHLRPIYLTSDLMVNPIPADVFLDDQGWYYAFRVQMGI